MLILLILSGLPDLIIVTDDNWKSQVIRDELTRDWSKGEGPVNLITWKLNNVHELIKQHATLHWVDINSQLEREKYKVPRLGNYPQYKFGVYSQNYHEFDDRCFSASSIPLLSVLTIAQTYDIDNRIKEWHRTCQQLRSEHYLRRVNELYAFAKQELIDDLYLYFSVYPSATDELDCPEMPIGLNIDAFEDNYRNRKNFPQGKRLVLPPKPTAIFPWEPEYDSDNRIGIIKCYQTLNFSK